MASALAQLQAIHDFLAQTSPDYAVRIINRLTRRSIQSAISRITPPLLLISKKHGGAKRW
jgi:hypothetical protein